MIKWIAAFSLIVVACGVTESLPGDVETADAVTVVEDELLSVGEYTFTVLAARMAYSDVEEATAVAAMVSVTGMDSVCMFWFIEGRIPGDGIIVSDRTTRQFSVSGEGVPIGSPEEEPVLRLKQTPEGAAVVDEVGCRSLIG